jgi:hypothetical protein
MEKTKEKASDCFSRWRAIFLLADGGVQVLVGKF